MTARVCQVGLDVVLQAGGITRAIADIHDAVGGDIISFTHPALGDDYPTPEVIRVSHGAGPWAARYGFAPSAATGRAAQTLARADVVIIHSLYRYHFDWAVRRCRRLGLPYVVMPHGSLDPYVFTYRSLQKRAWLALGGRAALEGADRVVFVTRRELEKARLKVQPRRPAVMPLPVAAWMNPAADREAARRARGYATTERVFLCLGRLHPMKRPLDIIRAFALAQPMARNARLLIVGPDTQELSHEACRRLARALGAEHVRIEAAAFGMEKASVLACADVMLNFSWRENFGYALCEGLAAGLPSIVSTGNDLGADLVAAGCAWQLGIDTLEELARHVVAASRLSDAELDAMGRRGREWVQHELSPLKFRNRLSALLSDISGK